jgi:3',5'-cyclic AMP phosphodiesterase CpdA
VSTPLLIAQITDLHIKRRGQLAYGVVDTAGALERCVAALNALRPRPAIVVVSGDLVDTGHPEEYEQLLHLLRPLELPLAVLPGNHDDRTSMRRAFPDQSYAAADGPLDTHLVIGGVDLFLLDSHVPGQPHGGLSESTLAWLEDGLAGEPRRPALLFLHHPPFVAGIWHMDRQNLMNAAALGEVVRRHRRVRMVAAGHVHRSVLTQFAGVPATICPAPNHAVDLDLGRLGEPSFRIEPPGFHLHAWFDDDASGRLVTHLVGIGEFRGPYPFFDAQGHLL